jgi:hypothetical protein
MRASRRMALAALTFAAMLGMSWPESGRIGVGQAQAAGGCGVGFHRGPYGGCRPNVYGGAYGGRAYGVYGGRAYGYRGGRVYGGRAVYGRRVGGYHGARGFHGGGRFRR